MSFHHTNALPTFSAYQILTIRILRQYAVSVLRFRGLGAYRRLHPHLFQPIVAKVHSYTSRNSWQVCSVRLLCIVVHWYNYGRSL